MKKCVLIALMAAFSLLTYGASCFGGTPSRTVANTSKKGSLLIFPLIKIGDLGSQDTIITLTNDYTSSVNLNCFYKYPSNCACAEFSFFLTANQSLAFSAKTGRGVDGKDLPTVGRVKPYVPRFGRDLGYKVGELKCFAVNSGGYPISFNFLSGTATIGEDDNQSWEYDAWRFAVGYGIQHNKQVAAQRILTLTGTSMTYDACPQRLIFDIEEQAPVPSATVYPLGDGGARTVDNRITLVPCKQDCVSDNETMVRASLKRYSEYENDASPYTCFNCDSNATALFSKSLSGTDALNTQIYSAYDFMHIGTPGGMVVVDTDIQESADCPNGFNDALYGIPVLGVMSKRFHGVRGPIAGETPTVLGPPQPQVKDASGREVGAVTIRY